MPIVKGKNIMIKVILPKTLNEKTYTNHEMTINRAIIPLNELYPEASTRFPSNKNTETANKKYSVFRIIFQSVYGIAI
jgi:hypothetical protein